MAVDADEFDVAAAGVKADAPAAPFFPGARGFGDDAALAGVEAWVEGVADRALAGSRALGTVGDARSYAGPGGADEQEKYE